MHNKVHQVLGMGGTTQPCQKCIFSSALSSPSSLADCWSSDSLLGVPGIAAGMPIDRFKVLLQCFHHNDNATAVPRNQAGHDRLHKIRPMITRLRETWRSFYHPPREQSIDEAMVRFKGRSSMKQYVPKKPTKCGYKVWCLCSPNGITNDCEVYEGATDQLRDTSLSTAVVLRLAQHIYNKPSLLRQLFLKC